MQKSNQNSPSAAADESSTSNYIKPFSHQHPNTQRGRIELIIGPMFAGKSTELLRRVKRHEIAGSRCLRIKYAADTRYSVDSIATHDRYQPFI